MPKLKKSKVNFNCKNLHNRRWTNNEPLHIHDNDNDDSSELRDNSTASDHVNHQGIILTTVTAESNSHGVEGRCEIECEVLRTSHDTPLPMPIDSSLSRLIVLRTRTLSLSPWMQNYRSKSPPNVVQEKSTTMIQTRQ